MDAFASICFCMFLLFLIGGTKAFLRHDWSGHLRPFQLLSRSAICLCALITDFPPMLKINVQRRISMVCDDRKTSLSSLKHVEKIISNHIQVT